MKKLKSYFKTASLVASTAVLVLAIGISSDVLDLVREREQKAQKLYSTNQLNLSLSELSSQGSTSVNVISVLEAEDSDSEIEEIKAAIFDAKPKERKLDFKLVSSDLVDVNKLNDFLERSDRLLFTGLEYDGKKILQTETSANQETNTLIANLRLAVAEESSPWALVAKMQEGANALFEQLKKQGPVYTINDAGVVQLLDSEASLVQAFSNNFSTVALLTHDFYSQLKVGHSLAGASQHVQSSLLELDGQQDGYLRFNLLREFQSEVDSRDYFVAIGWTELNRFRLVRMVPIHLSDTDEREEICDNGVDDNYNGQADCEDEACGNHSGCVYVDPELDCYNGVDDDSNGYTDCDDLFCQSLGVCAHLSDPPTVSYYEDSCDDGVDNDFDGMTDCSDSDCSGHWYCSWESPLDCSSEAPFCPDGLTLCADGYDAGGWCYYPCNDCHYYESPPEPPVISNPQPWASIGNCDGSLEVSGYADGADHVEVYIDGSYAGSSNVEGGQWQTQIYPSSGTRSIYAVAVSYSTGQSENSLEYQFYFDTDCEPLFPPADEPTVEPIDSPIDSPIEEPTPTEEPTLTEEPIDIGNCGNGIVEDDEECDTHVENGSCEFCWISCNPGFVPRKTIWPFDGNKHICSGYSVNEQPCGSAKGSCNNGHDLDYNYRPPPGEKSWKCGDTICFAIPDVSGW